MSHASRVEAVLFAALEIPTLAERTAFLDSACADDAELRRQVEKLLKAHANVGDFLNKPVVEQLAAAAEPGEAPERVATDGPGTAPTALYPMRLEGGAASDENSSLDFLEPATRADSLGRLGHYEILEVLGQGGFGIVFRAFDEQLQRVVAIKVLAPEMAVASPARKRFLREARSSARVRHDNVVQIYTVEEEPLPYLVMEFVPGETLQQRLERTGPLETPEVLRIGRQIAEGLAAAHAQGLIHRDIKPANILIEAGPNQHAKITDFGLARAADDASMTQSGILAGTPMFMSPEQASADALDHRTDLFSLGSVLYVLCSGRPPFRAPSTLAVLKRVAEDTPRPIREIIPEAPPWLCDLIAKLHAKKPDERIATAREVADLLGRGLAALHAPGGVDLPSVAVPAAAPKTPAPQTPQAGPTIKPRSPSRRWLVAAAVCLTLLGGLGFTEATGFTKVRGTVIRLFSPEGTLVVEVDDPGVSVQIDGENLVITGAGAKIRLKPGRYTVEARKDGKVVQRELVTVTKNGKQIVRVSQEPVDTKVAKAGGKEPDPKMVKEPTDAAAWERSVAAMPAEEQLKAVAARLKELNPGFDGKVTPTIGHGVVTGLNFCTDNVDNIAPVRALKGLTSLACTGTRSLPVSKGKLSDLSPIKGMPLTSLILQDCVNLWDLSPLKGMPLTTLTLRGCKQVQDLSPLKGMPLTTLSLFECQVQDEDLLQLKGILVTHLDLGKTLVRDLEPLKDMPLTFLNLYQCRQFRGDLKALKGMPLTMLSLMDCDQFRGDLKPLKGMPLTELHLRNCQVRDLEPLKGMRLKQLSITYTGVTDVKPLQGMPLEVIDLTPKNITQGLDILRDMKSLKDIGIGPGLEMPAAAFWARYDKGEFTTTMAPDRRAAEFVLSVGGQVKVNQQNKWLKAAADLPRESFRLTNVLLFDKPVTDAQLVVFKDCKDLTELILVGARMISGAGLACFKHCKNLTTLNLHRTAITAEGLAHFAECKNLTFLNLSATKTTDAALAHFKDCKNLTILDLSYTPVTDAELAYFKDCTELTNLSLRQTQVGDAGVGHFKNCTKLTSLNLNATQVGDEGGAHFKNCKDLTDLQLIQTQVSDAGLAHFKDCKNLVNLNLTSTRVGDEGLAHFKGCKNLWELSLSTTQVSDAGLAHFEGCTKLRWVNLSHTQVGDAGLAHFKECKKLERLEVKKSEVTATGIDDLSKALPKCRIEWDGGVAGRK